MTIDLRRITHILFTAVFTVLTVGITVNKHYSQGELYSIAIFSEPKSCCEGVCNCCDEESETIQFLVDYTFSTEIFESDIFELEVFAVANVLLVVEAPNQKLSSSLLLFQDLSPPDKLSSPSFFQSYLL